MKRGVNGTRRNGGPAAPHPPRHTYHETLKESWLTDPGAHPKLGPPWASPALLTWNQLRLGILLCTRVKISPLPPKSYSRGRGPTSVPVALACISGFRNKTDVKRNLKGITVPKKVESFCSKQKIDAETLLTGHKFFQVGDEVKIASKACKWLLDLKSLW